jgi:hypothetical protein
MEMAIPKNEKKAARAIDAGSFSIVCCLQPLTVTFTLADAL